MLKLNEFIISESGVIESLRFLRQKGEPPQALILVGAESLGKYTLARTIAADWLCLERQDGEACGQCDSCRRLDSDNHPDLIVVSPSPDQIKIEQVRDLRNRLNFAPLLSPYRAIIVERAHLLNLHAANALLKTLEEPPPRTFFLLTANSTDQMLPTVLSRCRVIYLGPLKAEPIESHLQQSLQLLPERARLLAEYADGAPGRAIQWAQEESQNGKQNALSALDSLMELFARLGSAKLVTALRRAEEFRDCCKAFEATSPDHSTRSALAHGLEWLAEWYRDTLALDYGSDGIRFRSKLESLNALRQRFPPEKRLRDVTRIIETRKAILGNANAPIATEALFIQLLSKE
jgi:DNA polymerase III delta' subunit